MITKEINGKTYLFAEVPGDCYEPTMCYGSGKAFARAITRNGGWWYSDDIIPKVKCQIIGKASELSEEQWEGIVERQLGAGGRYADYSLKGSYANYGVYMLQTATESGSSLLSSLNLKPETTLILQKQ